jgi:hypothetical protein
MPTPEELQSRLNEAESAYHALMTGKSAVQVAYENGSATYTQADKTNLRAYIQELKSQLGIGGGRSSINVRF